MSNLANTFFNENDEIMQKIENDTIDDINKTKNYKFNFFAMYCYDNTWKSSLDILVKKTDFIIFDLRGYSKSNIGCYYEINYLAHNFPMDDIIFIINDLSDRDYILKTLYHANSHNFAIAGNKIKIFKR